MILRFVRRAAIIGLCALFGTGLACSIPNLESPECAAARGAVRELYSYHFGNDMHFSPQTLAGRKRFLTTEFYDSLSGSPAGRDPFTKTDESDPPRAFQVGNCTSNGADGADLEVLLFWKTDVRSEQRELIVGVVRRGNDWLVNSIRPK